MLIDIDCRHVVINVIESAVDHLVEHLLELLGHAEHRVLAVDGVLLQDDHLVLTILDKFKHVRVRLVQS